MKKRIISLLLVLTMVLTLVPVQAFATDTQSPSENPFADVQAGNWFYDNVMYCFENGLFSGVTTTEFAPQGTMTRGMFVTVLGRMAEVDQADYQAPPPFTDVSPTSVFAPYIAWAAAMGITSGKGDGTFDPNGLVTREQMATFIVRYFDKYEIPFPEATVTSQPRDFDKVAEFAKESVLKLWGCGLFQGDTWGNFNPKNNATRAEAAAFCSRSDLVIEQWFIDTGVKEEGEKEETTTAKKPSYGGGSYGGGSTTRNYKVTFVANGKTSDNLYAQGTALSTLVPEQPNGQVFLGWYEDSAYNTPIDSKATLTKDVTLYAKFAAATKLDETGTQNFVGALNQDTGFSVKAGKVDEEGNVVGTIGASDFTFRNVTDPSKTDGTADIVQETVKIVDGVISSNNGGFTLGHTYQIELTNEEFQFDTTYGDTAEAFTQAANANKNFESEKVRIFNFSIAKDGTVNLQLNNEIIYIDANDTTDISAADVASLMEYQGLYLAATDANGDTVFTANDSSGSFTYTGNETIEVGDTVSIYKGTKPSDREAEKGGNTDNDDASYVKITGIDDNTYQYVAAETDDVMFTPDVLPIDVGDMSWTTSTTSVTVANTNLDFADAKYDILGLSSETVVEEGDYLAFYTGDFGNDNATDKGYGIITEITPNGTNTTITYASADEKVVFATMDVYDETQLSREEVEEAIDEIEDNVEEVILSQLQDNNFFDDAGLYLAEASLLTDEVRDIFGDDLTMKDVTVTYADGTPVGSEDLELMGNIFGGDDKKVSVSVSPNMNYFDGTGVRAEVAVKYDFEIQKSGNKNKLEISLQAVFEQELTFGFSVSGGAVWKKKWIFPYIADYKMTGNMDLGTYTGIAISATAKLAEDDKPWGMPWPESAGQGNAAKGIYEMSTSIKSAMEKYEKVMPDAEGSAAGGLADKYADFMGDANEEWIDLFVVKIFETKGNVDPFHIVAYSVQADFVVSANLNVALGLTFHYVNHKRHSFNLILKAKSATSDSVDLATNGYQFDFYVMGTIGIRAGVRVKMLMGLFSTKIAGIGLQIEAGAYAQLWGYFYYSLSNWYEKNQWVKNSSWSGAVLIEIGAYLDVKFIAEALNGKFSFAPTLYGNQWPFFHVGQRENVYDFAYEDDPTYKILNVDRYTLPKTTYDMAWMDLKTGEQEGNVKNYDEFTNATTGNEKRFAVELSNKNFTYNPNNNVVAVANPSGAINQSCDMTVTWLGAPLASSSEVLSRTITLDWSTNDFETMAFVSNGGSAVDMISQVEGSALTLPSPTRVGYTFDGWHRDSACTQDFTANTMPAGNTTLYAAWRANTNTPYTVKHYQAKLDGTFELIDTVNATGTTDAATNAVAKTYTGFTAQPITQGIIAADGKTVVEVFYQRTNYTVTFDCGETKIETIVAYGAEISEIPAPSRAGYTFGGWNTTIPDTMPANALTFEVNWTAKTDTPYTVVHYKENLDGTYTQAKSEQKTGTTGTTTNVTATNTYTGYGAGEITQTTIAADGSAIVRIEYPRNSYTLTWALDGGSTTSDAADYTTGSVKYGTTIVAPADPTKDGHIFAGWTPTVVATMPAQATTYTATWDTSAYNVTFDANEGTGTMEAQSFTYSVAENLNANTFTRANYTFAGWNTQADGTGTDYADGASFTAAGATTLYAQWTGIEYIVTFNPNGGDVTPTSQDVTYGGTYGELPTPTRTGYDFDGWFTAATDGTEIESTTTVEITAAQPLYAQWTAKVYDISYVLDGGTAGANAPDTHTYGTATAISDPTKTGYTFAGWTGDATGKDVTLGATAYTDDITLTATWTANKYDVTFDANEGEVTTQSQEVTYDSTYGTLPISTRAGHNFVGWFTAISEGTQVTESTKVEITTDQTLYARWTLEDAYTITYQGMEGAVAGTNTPNSHIFGTDTTIPNPTKTGYTFDGWTGGTLSSATKNVTLGAEDYTDDITLTATWTGNKYTVSFDANGGMGGGIASSENSVTYGQIYGTFINPFRSSYTFDGWFTAATGGDEVRGGDTVDILKDITLYAHWAPETYDIIYILDGGTAGANAPDTHTYDTATTIPNPTKTGYTFGGWEIDGTNEGTELTLGAEDYTDDITLTAIWTGISSTVTFDVNGGNALSSEEESATVTYGGTYTLPTPTYAGYNFVGWFTAKTGGTQVTASTTVTTTENQPLYAQWTNQPFIVSFGDTRTASATIEDAWAAAIACNTTADNKATITLYEESSSAITSPLVNEDDYLVLDTASCTLTFTSTAQSSRIQVTNGTLDIIGDGKITGQTRNNGGIGIVELAAGGTGTISLTDATIENIGAEIGSVAMCIQGGTFEMYSGKLTSGKEYPLYVRDEGTGKLYSGTLEGKGAAVVAGYSNDIYIMPSENELIFVNGEPETDDTDVIFSSNFINDYTDLDYSAVNPFLVTYSSSSDGTGATTASNQTSVKEFNGNPYLKIGARTAATT